MKTRPLKTNKKQIRNARLDALANDYGRKRKPKTERQKWEARLDALASEYVRKRAMVRCGACERCKTLKTDITKDDGGIFPAWKLLQWAHYRGRNRHSVRWDESDAAGLCGGCHTYLDRNPEEKVAFFLELLGQEEFDRLNMRAEFTAKHTRTDYRLIEIYLMQKIKELGSEVQDGMVI